MRLPRLLVLVAVMCTHAVAEPRPRLLAGVDVGLIGIVHPQPAERARGAIDLHVGVELDTISPRWRVGSEVSLLGVADDFDSYNVRIRGAYVSPDRWSAAVAVGTFTCPLCGGLRDPRFLVRAEADYRDVGAYFEVRTTMFDAGAAVRPYGTEVVISSGITTNTRYSWIPASVLLGVLVLATLPP